MNDYADSGRASSGPVFFTLPTALPTRQILSTSSGHGLSMFRPWVLGRPWLLLLLGRAWILLLLSVMQFSRVAERGECQQDATTVLLH